MGCHFLPQGIFPDPGIEPTSPASPELQTDSVSLHQLGSLWTQFANICCLHRSLRKLELGLGRVSLGSGEAQIVQSFLWSSVYKYLEIFREFIIYSVQNIRLNKMKNLENFQTKLWSVVRSLVQVFRYCGTYQKCIFSKVVSPARQALCLTSHVYGCWWLLATAALGSPRGGLDDLVRPWEFVFMGWDEAELLTFLKKHSRWFQYASGWDSLHEDFFEKQKALTRLFPLFSNFSAFL